MAAIPDTVAQSVKFFLAAVQQHRRIEAAYIYGSQARNRATEWSDIDLAIISPDFSEDLFQEQLDLMQTAICIDDRIEPRPFRPEDFKASEPLVSEIQRTGVQVA